MLTVQAVTCLIRAVYLQQTGPDCSKEHASQVLAQLALAPRFGTN